MQPQIKSPDNKLNAQERTREKIIEILDNINLTALVDTLGEIKCRSMGWVAGGEIDIWFRESIEEYFFNIRLMEDKDTSSITGATFFAQYKGAFVDLYYNSNRQVDATDVLHAVIHELLHVISADILKLNIGFSSYKNKSHVDDPINEGLTELFTDSILSEYIFRSGEYNMATKEYFEYARYVVYRIFSEKIVDIIAEESGVSRDVVIKSMLGHYMRADWREHMEEVNKLASEELRKLFKFSRKNLTEEEMWEELNAIYKYERNTFFEKIKSFCTHLRRKFKQYKYMRPHVEAIFGRDVIGYID